MTEESRIRVNGEWRDIGRGDLASLMAELGHSPESGGVAVAVNHELVPKGEWTAKRLQAGDAVEIVSAVQGG